MSALSARSRVLLSRGAADPLFFTAALSQRSILSSSYQGRVHACTGTRRLYSQKSQQRPRFSSRLRTALNNSKIQWFHIPVGLGIGFLGLVQFYRVSKREREK